MNDDDKAMIGKILAGRISVDEFQAIIRRAVQAELARLRERVNQKSTGKEVDHVRTW